MKEMREQAEKFAFQAEVNRMMKLIINSLYKNKEVSLALYKSAHLCFYLCILFTMLPIGFSGDSGFQLCDFVL